MIGNVREHENLYQSRTGSSSNQCREVSDMPFMQGQIRNNPASWEPTVGAEAADTGSGGGEVGITRHHLLPLTPLVGTERTS